LAERGCQARKPVQRMGQLGPVARLFSNLQAPTEQRAGLGVRTLLPCDRAKVHLNLTAVQLVSLLARRRQFLQEQRARQLVLTLVERDLATHPAPAGGEPRIDEVTSSGAARFQARPGRRVVG